MQRNGLLLTPQQQPKLNCVYKVSNDESQSKHDQYKREQATLQNTLDNVSA